MINLFRKLFITKLLVFVFWTVGAQESLLISGGFQTNGNLFLRDSAIGAAGIPQYDYQLFGAESWLDLNMSYNGFNGGIRFDLFNNSNLLNPLSSYTAQGIGRWFINKEIDRLDLTVGYLYDQIGSGIIYRAYEERAQLLDNALLGVSAKYRVGDQWNVKAFTGKQKNLFTTYNSIIKGISINGFYQPNDSSIWSIAPGAGFVNRTYGDAIVTDLTNISAGYLVKDQFIPNYNTNAFTLFNTFHIKEFSWYAEAAFKPDDVFYDPNAVRALPKGESSIGKFVKRKGSVYYTSLGYAAHNLGITIEGKRTDGFDFRAEPQLSLNRGLVSYIPPMARINTYRLTAYYFPATQFLNEMAYQVDLKYGLGKHWNFSVNFSEIRDLDFKREFYKEINAEVVFKMEEKYQILAGIQHQRMDIELYFGKGGEEDVRTITPYLELLYYINDKTSLRIESQYMHNKHDIGSWVYGLVELGISPHWIFELSDMYNTYSPKGNKALHYPTAGMVFNYGNNRFGLRYVKQIQGIVCSGGICRLEPAFSGFRASITSTF
jgi:hypothetical protein